MAITRLTYKRILSRLTNVPTSKITVQVQNDYTIYNAPVTREAFLNIDILQGIQQVQKDLLALGITVPIIDQYHDLTYYAKPTDTHRTRAEYSIFDEFFTNNGRPEQAYNVQLAIIYPHIS